MRGRRRARRQHWEISIFRHAAWQRTILALISCTGAARAELGQSKLHPIDTVSVTGNSRTRRETLIELLPRRPPALFSDAELAELERRIDDLAIFDRVSIERRGAALEIDVREKWTLIPSVEFASSKTLADTYALVGLTEYNAFGTGNQLGLDLFREQRGWGIYAMYDEHPYRRHRWSLGLEAAAATAQFRFEDGSGWSSAMYTAIFGFTSPPWLSDHFNYKAGGYYVREVISDPQTDLHPPSSHALGPMMTFTWDSYRWDDLVPQGVRANLLLTVGAFVGAPIAEPRHLARLELFAAQRLARTTVLALHCVSAASTRGNAGFSQLLGSVGGVRGLEDGYYRTWLQAVANLELRQALPIAQRWALQGVLFSDAASFEQIAPGGGRGQPGTALGFGGGARLIPTWLANVVLRADLARLVMPTPTWFVQLGLNQYF